MKHTLIGMPALAAIVAPTLLHGAVVTFESVTLAPESHWNGSEMNGTPSIGPFGETAYTQARNIEGVGFQNVYTDWFGSGSWSGFAVSNHTNTTTSGFTNQYSAYTGSGAGGSANYAVAYYDTYAVANTTIVNFSGLTDLAGKGASFTNTTYAALEMLNGGFGKKFGGDTGNDADWFKLTILGYSGGSATGSSLDFYLADYRFANNSQDYIVDEWTYLDFTTLGTVDELRFVMSSSDGAGAAMKTPAYFAMDNFLAVPEPSSLLASLAGLGLLLRRKR